MIFFGSLFESLSDTFSVRVLPSQKKGSILLGGLWGPHFLVITFGVTFDAYYVTYFYPKIMSVLRPLEGTLKQRDARG